MPRPICDGPDVGQLRCPKSVSEVSVAGDASLTYSEMSHLSTRVAATSPRSACQSQRRAVGLNMSKTLTVVALLRLGGARMTRTIQISPVIPFRPALFRGAYGHADDS